MNDRAGEPARADEERQALDPLRWAARRSYQGLRIVWQAIMHLIDDGGMTFAGHIAFMTLFSMFPFLIFLTTVAGEIGQSEEVRDFVTMALGMLPPEVGDAIRPAIVEVTRNRRTGLMTVSIVAALWATSSGIEALREALNKAYGVEEPRPIWFCRLRNLAIHTLQMFGLAKNASAAITVQYPEEKWLYPDTYRGRHRLTLKIDDTVQCTACYLCATACPAECIYIEAGEYADNSVEKFPIRYEIDTLRCVYCGYCVEACPCDAIRMDSGTHPGNLGF